jgi:flagellar L-ring protein precursor FlgH
MTAFRCFLAPATLALAVFLGGPVSAQGQSSLYSDPTATEPGDVLTVVIDEQTSAQRASRYEGSSSSEVSGSGSAAGNGLAGQFGANAQIENETANSNQTVQSGTLTGTMTVRVVDVNEAGNLVVTGERNLTVNGATHVMEVSGIVRTDDIRHNNTVLSHQIADAKVKYNQSGARHNGFFSKGFLLKAGSAVLVGISIFLGLN